MFPGTGLVVFCDFACFLGFLVVLLEIWGGFGVF